MPDVPDRGEEGARIDDDAGCAIGDEDAVRRRKKRERGGGGLERIMLGKEEKGGRGERERERASRDDNIRGMMGEDDILTRG
jgi:hypothetical protein